MDIKTFKRKFDHASTKKETNWKELYREAMELYSPQRENFDYNVSGERKGRRVYTSAPYIALDKAANNIQSSLTPHMKKWVQMKAGRNIPEENREQAELNLQDIRDTLFDFIFASNFDLAASEFYKDIIIGTSAMLVTGTAKEPLMFTTVPLNELYIATGPMGTIDTVFRKCSMPISGIVKKWDDAKLTDDLVRIEKDDPEKEVVLIEGTIPKMITVFNPETEMDEEVDGFGYYVMHEKGERFLVERDMPVSPWIVSRWSVLSGEEWGRGPAIVALNDAKTLNQFIKLHMQSMEVTVHPMFTAVDDGVINISNIRIGPGKIIPVSANDGAFGATLKELRVGGNFNVGQMEIQRLETSINDQLYTQPLGPLTLPVKTATEVSIRQQELSKRIGSAFARLQYEFIKPLINLCLYQLDRMGKINMNNYRVDGHTIAIEAVSPLAQSQSQDEINNVTRYVEFAMGVFGPEVALSMMKPEEIMAFMSNQLNVPAKIKMTDADKAKARQMLEQLSAQQQMQQQPQQAPQGNPNGQPTQI